jgi:hypothetical protein
MSIEVRPRELGRAWVPQWAFEVSVQCRENEPLPRRSRFSSSSVPQIW